jgi:DNA adenine methylase
MKKLQYSNAFKYMGSKLSMLPFLIKDEVLPEQGEVLVEPFLGSCSLLLNTDYNKYYFNDINEYIIDFFKIMLNINLDEVEKTFKALNAKFVTTSKEETERQKSKDFFNKCRDLYFNKYQSLNDLQKCSLFCFLTYNNFGGKPLNKSITPGDLDRNKELRMEVYKAMQAKKDKIFLYCMDYKDFIKEVLKKEIQEDIVLYLDPPYVDSFKYDASNNVNDIAKDLKVYFEEYDFLITIQSNFKNENVIRRYKEYQILEIERELNLQTGKEEDNTSKEKLKKIEVLIIKDKRFKATREYELNIMINHLTFNDYDVEIIKHYQRELKQLKKNK